MASEPIVDRMNRRESLNWLKASCCLFTLKEGLLPFTERHMRNFHDRLLRDNRLLGNPCRASCKAKANKFVQLCSVCSEWRNVILRNHIQPDSTINWDNCFPPRWRQDHWEVAKAYMPRGQGRKQKAECDASALLNLINHCTIFSFVDPRVVSEVIRCRNELMHSCDNCVTDEWIRNFHNNLKVFVEQIGRDAGMEKAAKQINMILKLDLCISVPGSDFMDGLQADSLAVFNESFSSVDPLSQLEAELLQELQQEFVVDAAEDGDTNALDVEQVKKLQSFFEANKDWTSIFVSMLYRINSQEIR